MDDDTPYAQKYEDSLMNVNPSSQENGFLESRNLFRQKDEQRFLALSCGKWLQIVKNSPKVSCEVSTFPSHNLSKLGENSKVVSLPTKTFLSPSIGYSQGTLQFTTRANQNPQFVFKLENQKEIYVASLSSKVKDPSYMIHLQNGESSSPSSPSSRLIGRIKVSTSSLNERIIERKFVLFSSINGAYQQILPCKKKNRGLSAKVVDVIKNNQCTSRLRCSQDQQLQEPNLENNLSTNLETLAVVVKQEFPEENIGGWGLKFLEKSRALISMDVVIPSGIHGGPEDGPQRLIQRWKSQGKCDCGGWDLGCSLTLLKGQQRKEQFELYIEGSKHEASTLRIVYVRGGLYLVQFQTKLSILQSFSIALAFIHSQKLRPLLM